ncbi:MAG: hypothetical protein NTY32_14685, partial [Bacteroidia bacterium]|nr:hypothetical protein [Bacteroidia bacterium]
MLKARLTHFDFKLPENPFGLLGPVQFGGIGCSNPLQFGCYNSEEVVLGKSMREHLPFCGAAWHGKENGLADQFGMPTSLPVLSTAVGEDFAAYEVRLR